MSAPAPDPPPNPTGTTGDVKPEDIASSSSSSSGQDPTTPANANANAEGGDVKMEEPPKPEEIEDSLEDIPDHVRDVSQPTRVFRSMISREADSLVERTRSQDADENDR